jgi:FecR protein
MNGIKVWPHLTIVAVLCAVVGGAAAALWFRNEPKAEALTVPRAARLERVDGEVGLDRGFGDLDPETEWLVGTPNMPLTAGDRLYAGEDSAASVAFTGRNYARLDPDTSLDVLSLSDDRTQLALRGGSAIFDLGALEENELYEVATPYGAVELREPGLYHLGTNDDGSVFVSVLSGLAQVVGLAGSGQISKGEMLTLLGQTAAQVALSRLDPDFAGGLLDDYYGYRYPDSYDGRYADYNAYLEDPYYYDPYRSAAGYRHVPASVPGAWELDSYGDWQELDGHGYAWRPRVEEGWAPYQQGQWTMDEPYGLTWVSSEPWGYAPYHYGRWANVNNQWYWVPDRAESRPSYAPALVAFLPPTEANQIGWVPLAPGDPYVNTYYDSDWQPHYLGERVSPERVANFGVPGAVTVVPAEHFSRPIDREVVIRERPVTFERSRPVLDPLSNAVLRQAALDTAKARRGFALPPGLAKRLNETPVYASARPAARAFRNERGRGRRVETVPERQKDQKLQFKDERRAEVAARPRPAGPSGERSRRGENAPAGVRGRERQAAFEAGAERRDKADRGRPRQFERPNVVPPPAARRADEGAARPANERQVRRAEQRAQGERVGLRSQPPKQSGRERRQAAPQPQRVGPPQGRPNRQAQPSARPDFRQQSRQQPKAERRQGPPSRGGQPKGGQPKAQGRPGKGKGRP